MLTLESTHTMNETAFNAQERRLFKILSLRNQRVGTWAAGIMNMSPSDTSAYASAIVALGLQSGGESAIVERLTRDFAEKRVKVGPEHIHEELRSTLLEAESDFDADPHDPPPAQVSVA